MITLRVPPLKCPHGHSQKSIKMKKLFLPYELAFALKKKDFSYPCLKWYNARYPDDLEEGYNKNSESWLDGKHCSAPLYQQAVDWLIARDIFVEIYCNASGYGYILTKTNGTTLQQIEDSIFFEDIYAAYNKGITEALKRIA